MPVDVAHIRPARLKDAPALAAAYEEAWRSAYQGIIPHLSLERALAYIEDDELVEITPKSIRLRKRHLDPNERKKAERSRVAEDVA